MSIPFSSVPEHVQISIAKKTNIHDFINFYGSSRRSHAVAKKVKTRFTLPFEILWLYPNNEGLEFSYLKNSNFEEEYSFRQESLIDCRIRLEINDAILMEFITDEVCESITNFATATNSSVFRLCLQFGRFINYDPELFDGLLESAKVVRLSPLSIKNLDLIGIPALQRFHELLLKNVSDDDLIHLRMPCLSFSSSNISSFGINLILKEWMTGVRDIERIHIHPGTPQTLQEKDVLSDISHSLVEVGPEKRMGYLLKKEESDQIVVCFTKNVIIIGPMRDDFFSLEWCTNKDHFRY